MAIHLGARRTLLMTVVGYWIAWLSEFSSIHNGFPYGLYHYLRDPALEEVWVFGVPFFDSVSYTFWPMPRGQPRWCFWGGSLGPERT